MDDILQDFLAEAEDRLAGLDLDILALERGGDSAAWSRIFRAAHSIKGTAAFLGFTRLTSLAHHLEDILARGREGRLSVTPDIVAALLAGFDALGAQVLAIGAVGHEAAGDDSTLIAYLSALAEGREVVRPTDILSRSAPVAGHSGFMRVHMGVMENLVALTGELVQARNRALATTAATTDGGRQSALQALGHLVSGLQAEVLRARLQPVMQAWQPLPRMARDMAAVTGQRVRLEMQGVETTLDRQVLDIIRDPIAHLVRNALSHGIENTAVRIAAGKPEEGVITLRAATADGHIVMTVADDGAGMDVARIGDCAVMQGLVTPAALAAMTETDILQLTLLSGFSTARQVSDMAGRGVGLDAVSAAVKKAGGSIALHSVRGRGVTVTLRLPLTLAIIPALVVQSGGLFYALPQSAILKMVRVQGDLPQVDHQYLYDLQGDYIPVVPLAAVLSGAYGEHPQMPNYLVILDIDGRCMGVAVDAIDAVEEVVVKPLPPVLQGGMAYLGSALLACGEIAMIPDVNRLAQALRLPQRQPRPAEVATDTAYQQKVLLCRIGAGDIPCAIPLENIERLVDIDAGTLQRLASGEMVWHDGQRAVPLLQNKMTALDLAACRLVLLRGADSLTAQPVAEVLDVAVMTEQPDAQGCTLIDGIPAEFMALSPMPHQAKTDAARRVLLVDDSPFFCGLLTPMLQTAGYHVVTAPDANTALHLCQQGECFHVIISDIEMPGMNGLDFARRLKASESSWRDVPLLALSAHATQRDEARGRRAGFDAFITKFDREGLLQTLARLGAGA